MKLNETYIPTTDVGILAKNVDLHFSDQRCHFSIDDIDTFVREGEEDRKKAIIFLTDPLEVLADWDRDDSYGIDEKAVVYKYNRGKSLQAIEDLVGVFDVENNDNVNSAMLLVGMLLSLTTFYRDRKNYTKQGVFALRTNIIADLATIAQQKKISSVGELLNKLID